MNLPPLPELPIAFTTTEGDVHKLLKTYGQQCREAALEEAARLVEKYFDVNEPWMSPHDIRDLK